jgi:hypothetical protein
MRNKMPRTPPVEIQEAQWTRWTHLDFFFEDLTRTKVFGKQKQFFDFVEDIDNEDHICLCAGRGCGKTWSLAVVALWCAFVLAHVQNEPIAVAVLAGSKDESQRLFTYIRRILKGHKELDQYISENLKGGLRFTKDYIEFKDGSTIEALACSMTGVCGPRANLLIIDEAGLEEFKEDVKNESFEIITGQKWGRIIMASTPYYYRSPFVNIYLANQGWRKVNWSQEDCPWIKKTEIERKRKDYTEVEFKIRIQGIPTPQEGKMFEPSKLRIILKDPTEIHYSDYSRIIAGIDWGQNISQTSLVVIDINPVDKKVRVVNSWLFSTPDHSEIIPSIVQLLTQNQVTKIVMDIQPPSACAMMKKALLHINIEVREQAFTHGRGDAMYHNLKRLIEKDLIEIPHVYTGQMNTLAEQLREMQWEKDPKVRTDLVDALALACSEEGGYEVFREEETKNTMKDQMKAWTDAMKTSKDIKIVPDEYTQPEAEEEPFDYPKELQGNKEDQIFWEDPNFGDLRIMSKAEARAIYRKGTKHKLTGPRGERM